MTNCIPTRIILRNDTFEEWEKHHETILNKGELALVAVPDVSSGAPDYGKITYLCKIGDGETDFAHLNWLSANAADVYGWAKQQELPINVINSGSVVTEISWNTLTNQLDVYQDGELMIQAPSSPGDSNYTPEGSIILPNIKITQNIESKEIDVIDLASLKTDCMENFNTDATSVSVGLSNNGRYDNSLITDSTLVFFPAATKQGIASIPVKKESVVTSVSQPSASYEGLAVFKGTPIKINIGKENIRK